ncbi:MAG: L-serine ammonia-lyase, iron-sulfur-dependent, subunit alpha [Candidatus Fermentithermobacillus carboniphilus]|uniref:L-serine dehydratase n=1 Tax=Candidatus Fermentithermobacillus carboniphilus TaxID=3085328 RepID=A0AAT9LF56_9FIRM|nr:MAG: L-serine ammonia-lyase, iron-sulfur-dependent, subunit alpha [Candidatus Fermentithermobacillus carboniphilus]
MLLSELAARAKSEGVSLGQMAVRLESIEAGVPAEVITAKVRSMLKVMKEAVEEGLRDPARRSRSGLSGGDAAKVARRLTLGKCFPGNDLLARAISYSLAVSEVNACMGKIVAAPTAGSCGIVPGTFFALKEALSLEDEALVDALCAAGLVGQVIAEKATLSGAEGGCQAECGSAAAMAACGLTQMGGGTPEDCIHAAALALKGLMGLVCDPVAGLVEIPCVKRNATSSAVAIASAEMALSGVRSFIPPDEVISAMAQVGRSIPESLRETSRGGLAATETGRSVASKFGSVSSTLDRQG